MIVDKQTLSIINCLILNNGGKQKGETIEQKEARIRKIIRYDLDHQLENMK